jgi:hypothetical protein
MSDFWLRLALIVGALALALLVMLWTRRAPRAGRVTIDATGLGPGVYFFSSATCRECDPARSTIEEALGSGGFVEIRWEEQPSVFLELGIDSVPATLMVSESGSVSLVTGSPRIAMEGLGP